LVLDATMPSREVFSSQHAWLGLAALLLCLVPQRASAAPLRVGAGETYATPCAAVASAAEGDVIEIAPGVYRDSCTISVPRLTLRGTGKQPTIDLSATDHPAQYKGIYVVSADDVTLENLELTGAHISADNGENAAGVRVEGKGLTVRGCKIHDNQNGILGGSSGTLTIEHTEFFQNGLGNGCNDSGCTHHVYVANIDTLYFRFNWSHDIASDTPDKGHLLKSRAKANYILYNRITGEAGTESYEVELPNGGLAVVLGNLLHKGKAAGNPVLLSWGAEGASNPDKRLFVVNNTFVNDLGKGTFIQATGATLVAKNNLFVGSGMPSSTGALSADNLMVSDGGFVDRAAYDYRLKLGSPAIDKAVPAGMADQFSLTAVSEYVQPLGDAKRAGVRDVGAYELPRMGDPTLDAGAGSDAGARSPDAAAGDASTPANGNPDAASSSPDTASNDASTTRAHEAGPSDVDANADAPGPIETEGGCTASPGDAGPSWAHVLSWLAVIFSWRWRTRRLAARTSRSAHVS
jgi:hypothetical protein